MPKKRRVKPLINVKKIGVKPPNPIIRDRRYGKIKHLSYGSRSRKAQVTTHPIRKLQFPRAHKQAKAGRTHGPRFTIKTEDFRYLPGTSSQRQLGVPTALGDEVIMQTDFKPNATLKRMLNTYFKQPKGKTRKGQSRITSESEYKMNQTIRYIIEDYFRKVVNVMEKKIDDVVPKCTGRLRSGMKANLRKCHRTLYKRPYILKLNTLDTLGNPIFYANPVNNMPTDWLAHPPNEPLRRVIKGRVYHLFDEKAETHWFEKVRDFGRDIARSNMNWILNQLILRLTYKGTPNKFVLLIYRNIAKNTKFK